MSRAELAEAVNDHLWHTTGKRYPLDAHAIARYERGKVRWPSAPYRSGLRTVLGVDSDVHLGFRRTPPKVRSVVRRGVESGDVAAIRQMLDALTVSERRFGGGGLREQAQGYFSAFVRPRLEVHADGRTRRELFACAAQFALRVASMELDSGRIAQSRNLVAEAARYAQESGDLALEAWALARRGELDMHEAVLAEHRGLLSRWERCVQRAVACTGAATFMVAGGSAMARAFLLSKHALAVSMTGDRSQTQRLVGQVWQTYEQVGVPGEAAWTDAYGWHHLRHDESRCYSNLGWGEAAVHAALEGVRARHDARPKALSLGVVALGRISAGDLDGASEAGRELMALTERTSSQRTRLRLVEVVTALRPHRGQREIRELCAAAQPLLCGVTRG